jgi:hypothetical protein
MYFKGILSAIFIASGVAAQQQDLVKYVTEYIQGLPECSQTCIFKAPGVTMPLTFDTLVDICDSPAPIISSYDACIAVGCTGQDLQTAQSLVGLTCFFRSSNCCSVVVFLPLMYPTYNATKYVFM